MTVAIDDRLTAVEQPPRLPSGPGPGAGADRQKTAAKSGSSPGAGTDRQVTAAIGKSNSGHTPRLRQPSATTPVAVARESSQNTDWSTIVREGGRLKSVPERSTAQRKPQLGKTTVRRERKTGITGTGTGSHIKAISTKMVSVFATKFDLSLEADSLGLYLKEKLGREVKCRKIASAQSRFSSFCVTAECNNIEEMYDPDLWPTGSFVRRYYEPRRPRIVDAGETVGAEGNPRSPIPVVVLPVVDGEPVTTHQSATDCPDGANTM